MTKNSRTFKNYVLLIVAFSMISAGTALHAQTEITVEPGFNTILDAIATNPGATLILQRGGDYVNDIELEIKVPTIIKGEKTPATVKPAVITFFANPGQGAKKYMVALSSNLTISDVGLMGITYDDQQIKGLVTFLGNDTGLTLDGCFLQGIAKTIITNGKAGITINVKNCQFHNMAFIGPDNWGGISGGEWMGDNCNFTAINNTYFVTGRGHAIAGVGPNGSDLINHNSYVVTWGDTFFPNSQLNIVNKNNLFYDSQVRGYVGKRLAADGSELWGGDYRDWKADTLVGDVSINPHLSDSVGTKRKVQITNNLEAYSSHVLDFHAANHVATMTFFNHTNRVSQAVRYGWDFSKNLLHEDGNAVDPKFAGGKIPDAAYEMMFKERIERSVPAAMQGPGYPYYLAWIPADKTMHDFIWPLPINLKPTNEALWKAGDDGYPLGDLNWFPPEVKAAWEAGLPNPLVITSAINLNNESKQAAYITHDILRFKGFDQAVDVEVYSILGQKVFAAKNITEINVSSLKRGVYLVRVNDGKQVFKVAK